GQRRAEALPLFAHGGSGRGNVVRSVTLGHPTGVTNHKYARIFWRKACHINELSTSRARVDFRRECSRRVTTGELTEAQRTDAAKRVNETTPGSHPRRSSYIHSPHGDLRQPMLFGPDLGRKRVLRPTPAEAFRRHRSQELSGPKLSLGG